MKKYKFIFWDMDGTLANTYEGVTNCVKYAMEPYGIHLEGEEELRKFIGPPLRFSFTTYCGLSEEEAEKAIVRYRERNSGFQRSRIHSGHHIIKAGGTVPPGAGKI